MRLPRESPRSSRGASVATRCSRSLKRIYLSLSRPQLTGLVLWGCGAILAGSAGQNAVASALSPWGRWNNLRQYLREWLYDGSDRGPSRPDRTGRKSLLRPIAPVGPGLVAFRPAGPGR